MPGISVPNVENRGRLMIGIRQKRPDPGRSLAARMTDDVKREFARRLQAHMIQRGWNNNELAKRCTALLPLPARGQKRHKKIGRDLIGLYLRAKNFPGPVYLAVLCKAFGISEDQLAPIPMPNPTLD